VLNLSQREEKNAPRDAMPRNVPPTPRPFALLLPALLLGYPQIAESRTIQVPSEYQTIQAAIDSATHGDEIVVATGIHQGPVRFNGKDVNLRSSDPRNSGVQNGTIIQAPPLVAQGSWVIEFTGTESDVACVSGFTLTGGKPFSFSSGGAIQGNGTRASISFNRIQNNQGSLILDCDGVIHRNIIVNNESRIRECDGIILSNLIVTLHPTEARLLQKTSWMPIGYYQGAHDGEKGRSVDS
jgi:hypothetical protein